jgi:amino acid transporter
MSYLGHSMGREMGFLAAWAIISAEVIIPSALYVVLAPILNSVLQQYFHFSVPLWVCAIVLCALVTGITVLGIRGSSNVAVALSLFEIGVFLVLAITLIRAPFAAGRAGEGTGSGVHGEGSACCSALVSSSETTVATARTWSPGRDGPLEDRHLRARYGSWIGPCSP